MALRDLEAFLRQVAAEWDPGMDVSSGSPFDQRVIQRVLRRLGTDPFTVDMATFAQTRLKQTYPDVGFEEGGPLTDLLVKPATILLDPIVREVGRLDRAKSFEDPSILTGEEADALGANIFASRITGEYSRGVGRMLFLQPVNTGVTPNNFFTCKGGLHFFPQETQSIRAEEMLLNVDNEGLYYFDVNLISSAPGALYNIGPGSLVSVAEIPSATRVTNLKRFQDGLNEETPTEFISRAQGELTERSLVTLRGIAAKLIRSFPDVQRLNVVGFNDPEMQRDVISGGSLGPIVVSGIAGVPVADGEGAALSRRFYTSEVDFTAEVGSLGAVSNLSITIFSATGALNRGVEFALTKIVTINEVEIDQQLLRYNAPGPCAWSIRRNEITLSGIPGGILFPDSPQGTVTVNPNEVHIGGAHDVYTRGNEFEEATLTLDAVVDDDPVISGFSSTQAAPNEVTLDDFILDTNYFADDDTYTALENANFFGYTLHVQTGVNAGGYRVVGVLQISGNSPVLELAPDFPNAPTSGDRWKLVDELTIDLPDPKNTLVKGSDLQKSQYSNEVTTAAGTDFDVFGAAEGDVLRILEGIDAGDYALVADPLVPGFVKLRIEADMKFTESGVSYELFRANTAGGIQRPVVRIQSVELLDSNNQPQGTTIPYAKPIDVQTRAFQNPSRGVKHDLVDVTLGIVSQDLTLSYPITGSLKFTDFNITVTVAFAGEVNLAFTIATINAQLAAFGKGDVCVALTPERFGIRPFGKGGRVAVIESTGLAMDKIFGGEDMRTSCDVRSAEVDITGWPLLNPSMDTESGLDVLQIIGGSQIGFYHGPFSLGMPAPVWLPVAGTVDDSLALVLASKNETSPFLSFTEAQTFSPEIDAHIQIGSRSIGSARCYFLEPTTIEFDRDAFFTTFAPAGTVRYFPDPGLGTQLLPPPPGGEPITDGAFISSFKFGSASQDFTLSRVQPLDILKITTWPLGGTIPITDPHDNVAGNTLIYSVDNGPDRTVTFIRDDVSLNPALFQVSQAGIIDQINASFGLTVCSLTALNEIEFEADIPIVIRETGTANQYILGNIKANPAKNFNLGGASEVQRSNRSPYYGDYTIIGMTTTSLSVEEQLVPSADFAAYADPPLFSRHSYTVERSAVQRISTTDMKANKAEADLFYFDVELVSEGTGDLWNIPADQQMTVEGYRSDGWYLTTEDTNFTFSEKEELHMIVSRTILPDGVDDDVNNAIQVTGQNLYLTYDRAPLVVDVQGYISSDIERVVCSSPLSRHLIPYFIRFDLTYVGGSKANVILPDLEKYIRDLYPNDTLESSQIQKVFLDRGATSITNPLDLIAVVHEVDRTVTTRRSQDSVGVDSRLCTFLPDILNISRNVS